MACECTGTFIIGVPSFQQKFYSETGFAVRRVCSSLEINEFIILKLIPLTISDGKQFNSNYKVFIFDVFNSTCRCVYVLCMYFLLHIIKHKSYEVKIFLN